MIKVDHLRYFVAAAEAGSFAAAGSRLRISPTSIAYAVDSLENSLRVPLFVRKAAAGVTLTVDGRQLLDKCRSVLLDLEEIESLFHDENQEPRGTLVVGCQEGLAWTLAPRAIERMNASFPDLQVTISMTWLETRFESLQNGDADVLLTFLVGEEPPDHFAKTLLCQPDIYAMMRKGHPLQNSGGAVSLEELADYPQIFMKDGPALEYYYSMYKDIGVEPEIYFLSNASICAQAVIGKSDAVSLRILRPSHPYSPLGDELVYRSVSNRVQKTDILALTVDDRRRPKTDKRQAFIDICKDLFDSGEMRENIYY